MEKKNLHPEMAAAAAEAARVVAAVPGASPAQQTSPAQQKLDDSTPCGDWDLRTLLNHTILWTSYSAERRAHGQSAAEDLMSKDFTADPGFRADYAAQINKAVQAWSDPEVWAGDLDMMGNATPAADVAAMLIMEMALHGWDIAKSTGQEYGCDDAVAAVLLEVVQAQGELFRKYQGFGNIVAVPDDAPAFERALAASGRDPHWKPAP